MKNNAILILMIAIIWYPYIEFILHQFRHANKSGNYFIFVLHLTQSFIPLVLSVIATILYFSTK
jgi:hypothetical protein